MMMRGEKDDVDLNDHHYFHHHVYYYGMRNEGDRRNLNVDNYYYDFGNDEMNGRYSMRVVDKMLKFLSIVGYSNASYKNEKSKKIDMILHHHLDCLDSNHHLDCLGLNHHLGYLDLIHHHLSLDRMIEMILNLI